MKRGKKQAKEYDAAESFHIFPLSKDQGERW